MSEIRNSQDAWSFFKTLAQQVGGTNNISDAEIKELIKKADTNNDGLIFENELKDTLLTYDKYLGIEDSYLEAFEAIAKEDGVDDSISDDDIDSIMNGIDSAIAATGADEASAPADGSEGSGSSGGSGTGGGTGNGNETGNNEVTQHENVSRSDLEGKDSSALQNERSGLLNDLSSMRNEKNAAIADADKKTSEMQSSYDKATQDFTNLLATQEETEQSAIDASQKVQDLETKKSDQNSRISEQKSAIEQANSVVQTVSSSLSSLQAPPQFITETVTNADGTTSTVQKENPAYQTYLAQKAELESQLADAESDLADQENTLQELETSLTNIEQEHQQAIDEYCKIKESLGQLTPELATAQKAIQDTKSTYDKAKSEESDIASKYDSQIDILQNNLNTYNDVISQKELNVPEGYSVVDGQIVGGEGDEQHTLTPASETDLPEGATIDNSNTIRDADGNEIGRIFGADGEEPQIYIKEAAPLNDETINEYVDLLLNGNNSGDEPISQEDVWKNINGNGVDLKNVNSNDIAQIRELYNKEVERENAKTENNEEKLKSFDEMAAEMLKESHPESLAHITDAVDRANAANSKEQSFSEYLEEKGIDTSETSQIVLDNYLNDYLEEKTGSKAKYDLNDEKIDEVVSSLLNGAQENGEAISANELLKNYDFSSLSDTSVVKIVEQYNEKSETTFADAINNIELDEQQVLHITDSLINSLNTNNENILKSSNDTLTQLIDKSLNENNPAIIEQIIKSAEKSPVQVQKLISDNNLINKVDTSSIENTMKTELKDKLKEISEKEYTPAKLGAFNQDDDMMAIAHRGFSGEAPENTLAAIELAKQYGYNAVELDIAWTKDGIPVLLHDSTIGRTSNGPDNMKCSDMNYSDLLKYDFGSWAGEEFAGTKIPTFSEALDCCADNKLEFFAELKDTKDFDYAKAEKLVQEVINSGMQDNITWISFDKNALALIDKAMSDANLNSKLGYLSRDSVSNNTIKTLDNLKNDNNEVFLDIKAAQLTSSGAKKLADAGYEYGVWTVNDSKQIAKLEDLGCIALTSDKITQDDIERMI